MVHLGHPAYPAGTRIKAIASGSEHTACGAITTLMLKNIKEMYGSRLAALDGDIGHVKDFYFDDKSWVIRYLVADTGAVADRAPRPGFAARLRPLQPGRKGAADKPHTVADREEPVHRVAQAGLPAIRDRLLPLLWMAGLLERRRTVGHGGVSPGHTPSKDEMADRLEPHHRDDKHLRSTHEVAGYEIQATDGPIGQVTGLLVDDRSWMIHDLVVEAGHWYSGKEVLIAPSKIERISYEESKVFVSLTKEDIKRTAANELAARAPEAPARPASRTEPWSGPR